MKKALAFLVLITVIIFYFGFLQYNKMGVVKLTGYIVKSENLIKTLKDTTSKNIIELTQVEENDVIYKQGDKYFVGETLKKQVNLNYPIISNDKSRILNIGENAKLINKSYEKSDTFNNMMVASKNIYNTVNYEKVDEEEYYFILLTDGIYINTFDIEIKTKTNNYKIPLYSIINFEEKKIKYYELIEGSFKLKEIEDVDGNTLIKIDEYIKYEDFLNKLTPKTEIEEEETEKGEIELPDIDYGDKNEEEYVKPTVVLTNIQTNVYSMKAILDIEDKSNTIKKYPTIEVLHNGQVYLKKTFYEEGEIELTGLLPNSTFQLIGSYIYINENGKNVRNTFLNEEITTLDINNLNEINLNYFNNQIYSNKVVLTDLEVLNDITDEVLKGINKVVVKLDDNEYRLSQYNINKLKKKELVLFESTNNLESNNKYTGVIEIYDVAGNELKVNNNLFEIRTSKEMPQIDVEIINTDITTLKLGINVKNKDNVLIDNFRYEIYDMSQTLITKGYIQNNIIEVSNLNTNEVYKVMIYGDYDLLDGNGNQLNQLLKELNVSTEPVSSLGLVRLNFQPKEITNNKAIYELKIDEKATDSKLIDLLDRIEIYLNGELKSIIKDEEEVIIDNLESNTTYDVEVKTVIKQGDVEYSLKALSNLITIKTLKDDADVQIINSFTNSSMIDFDVRIKDIDGAIMTTRVVLEARNSVGKLVLMENIDINSEYKRITLNKLDKDEQYTFKFIAEEYNVGETNLTYEPSKVLEEVIFVTEEGVLGTLELDSILSQITSSNIFNINNQKKWKKTGDSKIDSLSIMDNVIRLSSSNGYARYDYHLPEYNGKKLKIKFKARYADGSNKENTYIMLNNNTPHLSINNSYKEFTYEVTMNTDYIGFRVNETADQNKTTTLEIKDLYIAEVDNVKEEYETYSEKSQYLGKINTTLNDTRNEIKNNEYYIKTIKNGVEKLYIYSLNNEHSITSLNSFELDKNSKYEFLLLFKIRDRYYELDRIELTTEDEVRSIKTNDDFYNIHPFSNYIVVNDLDLRTDNRMNTSYSGIMDFQGHTVYTDNGKGQSRMFRYLETSAIIKNIDVHADFIIQNSWRSMITERNYGTITNVMYTIDEFKTNYVNYNSLVARNLGVIENFVVKMNTDFYGGSGAGLVVGVNHYSGVLRNGYIYSNNDSIYHLNNGENAGVITETNNGIVENIFSIVETTVKSPDNHNAGNIVGNNNSGIVRNVYTYSNDNSRRLNKDINFGSLTNSNIDNVFYVNPNIHINSTSQKLSKVALKNAEFQDKLLNSSNKFNIDDFVPYGYYPQLIMSDVMPKQEYIELPSISDEDLLDILSVSEVDEQGSTAIAKVLVHNPSEEVIKSVSIKDLSAEVISQETERGLTTLTLKLFNPIKYVDTYFIKEIESIGALGLSYTRTYEDYEKILKVTMYKSIKTVADWQNIKNNPTFNYKLENDLDFNNIPNAAYLGDFSGKLDGGNYTIKNIETSSQYGIIIYNLKGIVKNLKASNIKSNKSFGYYTGFISVALSGSTVDNVHIEDVILDLRNVTGGLVGRLPNGSNIQNSSVTNMKLIYNNLGDIRIGGIVGENVSASISNCYAANINIDLKNVTSVNGVGGIAGISSNGYISDCYANGIVKTDYPIVGGIVGHNKDEGSITNCYSNVDIYSTSNYVGGIIGNSDSLMVNNNLSLGELYTSVKTDYIGRIVGNNVYMKLNNYAWSNQHLNGRITDKNNGEVLLDTEFLNEKATYEGIIKLGINFSYDDLKNNKLPKLFYKDSNTLLPNQKDNYLKDAEFEILESVIDQTIERSYISFRIENKEEKEITSIEIEDMEILDVRKNTTDNGITMIEVLINPIRFYDSYKLAKINYKENGEDKVYALNYKIDIQFFDDIESFEDWQLIDKNYAQNYRLIADIDFYKKENVNTNLIFNRLVGTDDGHTLKNLNIETNKVGEFFIKEIKSDLSNITFDNINITSTGNGNGLGIIGYTNGNFTKVNFQNNKIIGKNISYIGAISKNNAVLTDNVNLMNVEVTGRSFVGGLAGQTSYNTLSNINLKDITITGTSEYIGGMVGHKNGSSTIYTHTLIEADNINLTGVSFSGGIYGHGSATNVIIRNSLINGGNYSGGIFGGTGDNLTSFQVYNTKVFGKDRTGGIAGAAAWIYSSIVNGSEIKGDNNVGGLVGTGSTTYYNTVSDTTVEGNDYVGGLGGRGIYPSYNSLINVDIIGNNYVAGVVGTTSYTTATSIASNNVNVNISAKGDAVGGILAYYSNQNNIGNIGLLNIYNNILQNSNITGGSNVGGLIGKIGQEFGDEKNSIYSNIIVANVTATKEGANSGIVIGSGDLNAVDLVNVKVYNKSRLNGNVVTNDGVTVLNASSYVNVDDLKTKSFYTGIGFTTSTYYYDYTPLDNNNYPLVNLTVEKILVPLPTDLVALMAFRRSTFVNSPDIFVYPTDINKINIEFSFINDDLILELNEKEYPLIEKVMTFYYDYKEDITIKIKQNDNSSEYIIKKEELRSNLSVNNNNIYYIKNGILTVNNNKISGEYIHIYNNQALDKQGYIYNIETKEAKENMISNLSKCKDTNPLQTFKYNGMTVNTYYNYTKVNNKELNSQIFYKNGKLTMLSNNLDNLKDSIIIDSYNNNDYLLVLMNGKIQNLKKEINYPNNFKNYDIVEMNNNINDSSGIILVRYQDGSIYAFDYRTGRELINDKEQLDIFSFIKEEFVKVSNKTFTNKYTKAYGQIMTFEKEIEKKYESDYIEKYDPLKGEYEIYDAKVYLNGSTSELVNNSDLSINDNIYSNNELLTTYANVLNSTDTSNEGIKIFTSIIVIIGIMILLLGKILK